MSTGIFLWEATFNGTYTVHTLRVRATESLVAKKAWERLAEGGHNPEHFDGVSFKKIKPVSSMD